MADALRAERVTEDESQAAVRGAGLASLQDAAAVVLETDGSLQVVPAPAGPGGVLQPVRGVPEDSAEG